MASGWFCGEHGYLIGHHVKEYLIVLQNQEGQEYLALQTNQTNKKLFPFIQKNKGGCLLVMKHSLFGSGGPIQKNPNLCHFYTTKTEIKRGNEILLETLEIYKKLPK